MPKRLNDLRTADHFVGVNNMVRNPFADHIADVGKMVKRQRRHHCMAG